MDRRGVVRIQASMLWNVGRSSFLGRPDDAHTLKQRCWGYSTERWVCLPGSSSGSRVSKLRPDAL